MLYLFHRTKVLMLVEIIKYSLNGNALKDNIFPITKTTISSFFSNFTVTVTESIKNPWLVKIKKTKVLRNIQGI